jgi:hypothetical protein
MTLTTRLLTFIFCLSFIASTAQNFVQEFEDSASVYSQGWQKVNKSNPLGSTDWFQGNTAVFGPKSQSGYFAANYNSASGSGTISTWLFSPNRFLQNGDSIIFYTRTTDSSAVNVYPDRLQVRISQNGNSVNVGTTATDVGDFTMMVLEINPTYDTTGFPNGYPSHWRKYKIMLSGLPGMGVSGRFAFRYFVENGGPLGANSDYIGIDSVAYTSITNGMGELHDFSSAAKLFPNPSTIGAQITLEDFSGLGFNQVSITDLSGK